MDALIFHVISWPTLGCALLVYGFAPGALLRLIVLLYPRGHPRRRELIGELYAYPRIWRPFWVAQQLETALFEGLHGRIAAWRARRATVPVVFQLNSGGGVTVEWWISRAAYERVRAMHPCMQTDIIVEALSTGQARVVSGEFWHKGAKAAVEHPTGHTRLLGRTDVPHPAQVGHHVCRSCGKTTPWSDWPRKPGNAALADPGHAIPAQGR